MTAVWIGLSDGADIFANVGMASGCFAMEGRSDAFKGIFEKIAADGAVAVMDNGVAVLKKYGRIFFFLSKTEAFLALRTTEHFVAFRGGRGS